MRRHPCEYFIKYILTLPLHEAQQDQWVSEKVSRFGFPPPDTMYISNLREDIRNGTPAGFDTQNRYHKESAKFLRAEGIFSLHFPDAATELATTILARPPVRKLVEKLLLGRLEPKEVAKKVNSRVGEYLTEATIRVYQHYYWNTDLMLMADWVGFLDQYEEQEGRISTAIVRGGPAMALHVTGFQQNLESKEMLREMMEGLYFDFQQWKSEPTSGNKSRALAGLAKAATQVDVRLSEADSALRDSLKAFQKFRMRQAEGKVGGVKEIAPYGNFSESGAPLKELPPAKEEEDVDPRGLRDSEEAAG